MVNRKKLTKAMALSLAAVSSVAVVSYANNTKNNDSNTKNVDYESKIKLDIEKIDSKTVRVSVDNIQESIKSIQLSLKIEGDARFSEDINDINWLVKNEESESDNSNIKKNVKFNNNELEMFIVSNKALKKDGNKINICEIKLDEKSSKQVPSYKITADSYKYIVDNTNKQVEGTDIINTNDEKLTMNMPPTITLKNTDNITIIDNQELKFDEILSEKVEAVDPDGDEITLEVRNVTGISSLDEDKQNTISIFKADNPGSHNFKVTAKDRYNEKSSVYINVNVTETTEGEAPTISGVKENINIQSGEVFDLMEGVSARDFKGNILKVKVDGDFNLYPDKDSTYTITYSATDKYGKASEKQTKLTVIANEAPVITGIENKIISIRSNFDKLEGVNVKDDKDNLSKNDITVTGSVNPNKAGEYKLSYSIKDSGGKESKAQRIISVKGVNIENPVSTINLNETRQLNAIVLPKTLNQDITWESTNPKVVSIDANGNIKGISQGQATIKAISKEGIKVEESINIKVSKTPQGMVDEGGNGTSSDPLKFTISDDMDTNTLSTYLDSIKKLNPKVEKRIEEGNYYIYKIKVSNKTTLRKKMAGKSNEVYIELKVKKEQSNLIEKLEKFQQENSDSTVTPPSGGGGSNSGGTETPESSQTTVSKLIGTDRYQTAVKISKEGWSSADIVILVNGNDKNLVDGLTATPLASAKNAPILLTNNKELSKHTVDEIKRLNPSKIIVIGGETSIPQSIINNLKNINSKLSVQRIGGQTRYETSLNIAKEIDKTNNISNIYVGAGYGEADSLSISPVAGKDKAPIILTKKDGLDKDTYDYIKSQKVVDGYIIGGETKISDKAINQIDSIVSKDISKNRIAGAQRQDTNAKVIEKFYTNTKLESVVVAKDYDLVDALAVGPLASKKDMPVVLATNNLSKSQEKVLENKKSPKIYETGGGIKSTVIDKLKNLVNNSK